MIIATYLVVLVKKIFVLGSQFQEIFKNHDYLECEAKKNIATMQKFHCTYINYILFEIVSCSRCVYTVIS